LQLHAPSHFRRFGSIILRRPPIKHAKGQPSAGQFPVSLTSTDGKVLGLLPGSASSSSDPDGHIDDLAAEVGNVLADVFGTELVCERWKYCANYAPMLSEHGCERLSRDQPIVFSRP
jgi:hypothetical protein